MMDIHDPYSVLNLYPDCTYEEAKAAYRKAALLHHPDRHPPARKAEAERRFRILAHAFQLVCHELGHPIEPPELMPPTPGSFSSRPANLKSPSSSTALARTSRSASERPSQEKPERTVQPKTIGEEQSQSRTRELDELEEQVPFQDDDPYLDQPRKIRSSNGRSGPPRRPIAEQQSRGLDDYDRGYGARQQQSAPSRRSSFSHSVGPPPTNRRPVIEHDPPLAPNPHRRPQYADQQDLYSLKPSRRDEGGYGRGPPAEDWDFGLGPDDFFGSQVDRFGPASSMMSDIGLGFDQRMLSAFKGLNMSGPDPSEMARMDGGVNGGNCQVRMRQSKMVMGRTEDGSWAGKRMEKQMKIANGRLEVNENAQDIRVGGPRGGSGGGGGGGGGGRGPPRHGPGRNSGEDWDPPPAYQGGEEDADEEDDYARNPDSYYPSHHPQGRFDPHSGDLYGPGPIGMVVPRMQMDYGDGPLTRRRGSVSRPSGGPMGGPVGGKYYEEDHRLQRRPEPHYDYPGEGSGRPSRSMSIGNRGQIGGPNGAQYQALVRRPDGEVASRY